MGPVLELDDSSAPVDVSAPESELLELPRVIGMIPEVVASPVLVELPPVLSRSGTAVVSPWSPVDEAGSERTQLSASSPPENAPYRRPLGQVSSEKEQKPEASQKPSEPHCVS